MKQSGFYKLSQRYISLVKDLGGAYRDSKERPVYCCIQDRDDPKIYWAIPTSSIANRSCAQLDKIKRLCDLPQRDIRSCYYHIGHTNRPAIFRISNVLPITEAFVDGEYVSQGSHSRRPNKYEQHISSIYSHLKAGHQ